MGAVGFARAANFSMQKMTDHYLLCYRSVLEEQHA
jgi:hypothetical protein